MNKAKSLSRSLCLFLHVVSQGAQVGCSGDSLVVRPRDQPERSMRSAASRASCSRLRPDDHPGAAQVRRARRRRPLADHDRLPHGQPGADGRPGAAPLRQYRALATTRPACAWPGSRPRQGRGAASLPAAATRGGTTTRTHLLPVLTDAGHLGEQHDRLRPHALRGTRERRRSTTSRGCAPCLAPKSRKSCARDSNRRPRWIVSTRCSASAMVCAHGRMRAGLASGLEPALSFFPHSSRAAYPLVST